MIRQSLGLIETVGLAAAIEAADTAVKSANVQIIGYELTKGGGMVMVKMLGEVGAVNAAISAAAVAAARVNRVVSTKVIARMGEGLALMVASPETAQAKAPETKASQAIAVTVLDNEDLSLDCSSLAAQDIALDDEKPSAKAASQPVNHAETPDSNKKKRK
ncbi:BMC domain-containing protein [Budvicia diplopodorum]|uniref:BMC domain-containing protein n=1 Tax=Budvicia diplopodorum TaxID=1119056 RepID=UPI00135B1DDF|nr:BMC domain-containing protein [Budvicia diplopodorum]